MRLMGAPRGSGLGIAPAHPDKKPSFSAKPGREPGTTVVACGAAVQRRTSFSPTSASSATGWGRCRMAPPQEGQAPGHRDHVGGVARPDAVGAADVRHDRARREPDLQRFRRGGHFSLGHFGRPTGASGAWLHRRQALAPPEGLPAIRAERLLDGTRVAVLGAARLVARRPKRQPSSGPERSPKRPARAARTSRTRPKTDVLSRSGKPKAAKWGQETV